MLDNIIIESVGRRYHIMSRYLKFWAFYDKINLVLTFEKEQKFETIKKNFSDKHPVLCELLIPSAKYIFYLVDFAEGQKILYSRDSNDLKILLELSRWFLPNLNDYKFRFLIIIDNSGSVVVFD